MKSYVILGAAGSGKDTLVGNLINLGGYKSISTGQIYRDEAANGTELGLRAKEQYWGRGLICPDEMTNEIMAQCLINMTGSETLLINGYPRSLGQAQFLDEFYEISGLIHLKAEDDVVIRRLVNRGREDDTFDVIKKRIEIYHQNSKAIIEHYKKSNRYIELDAEKEPENVLKEALNEIGINTY